MSKHKRILTGNEMRAIGESVAAETARSLQADKKALMAGNARLSAELDALRAENERLKARVRELEERHEKP